jgi:light-regulated signal transduction histidine kinase (bacteriophytochrome)
MSNYVQLLARGMKGKLDGDAEEYMAFVTDAAQRMPQMLTDLLAYTKAGQTPELQAVDYEAVLTQVRNALQARITEYEAIITYDPLPTVQGDATRLGQVLQNLIGNLLKFCEEKPPRIHLSAIKEDHHCRFVIRDNGIGIDPKQASKLFQVFLHLHPHSEYPARASGWRSVRRSSNSTADVSRWSFRSVSSHHLDYAQIQFFLLYSLRLLFA